MSGSIVGLPDPDRSRAVLIGTATYDADSTLENLDAVIRNLNALQETLCRPDLAGFVAKHCSVVADPQRPSDISIPVDRAVREAEDVLLLYYAGHGLLDDGDLYLGLKHSTHAFTADDSFPYERLRRLVRDSSARMRVLILDCCFSGVAIGLMGKASEIAAAQLEIEGTYTITATPATKPALAPPGDRFTAFTGQLLRILQEGVPDAPDPLSMADIYAAVKRALRARGGPTPQQRTTNSGDRLFLTRNRARAAERPPTGDAAPLDGPRGSDTRRSSDSVDQASASAEASSVAEKASKPRAQSHTAWRSLRDQHPEIAAAVDRVLQGSSVQSMIRTAQVTKATAREAISNGASAAVAEIEQEAQAEYAARDAANRTLSEATAAAAGSLLASEPTTYATVVGLREDIAQLQSEQDVATTEERDLRRRIETFRTQKETLKPMRTRLTPEEVRARELAALEQIGESPEVLLPPRSPWKRLQWQRRWGQHEPAVRLELVYQHAIESLRVKKDEIRDLVTAKVRLQLTLERFEERARQRVASSDLPEIKDAIQTATVADQELTDVIATRCLTPRCKAWLDKL